MNTQHEEQQLLDDVVMRVVANPTASHAWHQMVNLMRRLGTPALTLQLEQFLLLNVPGTGLPGFFRATFLDVLTGRPEYLQQAGQLALTLHPFDADRLTTFLQYSWQRVLLDIPGRDAFQKRLQDLALPDIANRLSCWIVQQLKPEIVLRRREIKEIRKVAMIAPYLTNIKHPPTLMALQQAENLRQIGYEVEMYSAQEMRGPDFEHYLGCHSSPSEPQFVTAGWGQFLGQGARVNTGDMRFSLLQRWRSLLGQMALSDPDLVMFVGLYSGLAAAVFPMRPLLSLGINSVSPMLPADVWLTAQPELDARLASQWTKAFPESQAYYHSYRVRRPHLDREYSRSILGLDEGCLLWVTLVSESESRISGEWAHAMLTLLNKHAHIHWLIVGGNGAVPSALHTARAEQVRCISFCADAVKYLTVSDIYVNPPMMGGGFAVAESMALGIPALSLSGSDGGDKLGKYAQPDMRTYFQTLQSWMQHPELRKSTGLLMQQHFNDHLDLAKAPSGLKVACELAVERYAMRKA